MKRAGTVLLVLAVCFSLGFGVMSCQRQPSIPPSEEESEPPQVTQTAEVKVLDDSIFVNSLMYGEIQNTNDAWWFEVTELNVEFYDSRGYLLTQRRIVPVISVLSPGQKSPFKVYCPDEPYSEYTFKVESKPAAPLPDRNEIEVLNVNKERGSPYFKVELHNNGEENFYPGLLITFYDDQGRVRNYKAEGKGIYCLLPNQVKTFQIYWPYTTFSNHSFQVY